MFAEKNKLMSVAVCKLISKPPNQGQHWLIRDDNILESQLMQF